MQTYVSFGVGLQRAEGGRQGLGLESCGNPGQGS